MSSAVERAVWVSASCAPEDLLSRAGMELIGRAANGPDGLALLRDLEPDIALVDAVLPGMDGPRFLEAAASMALGTRPALLLMVPAGMLLPGAERLSDLATVPVEKPLTAASLAEALRRARDVPPALPSEKARRLAELLDALGVPEHPGRECLALAVAIAWRDRRKLHAMGKKLYPETGAQCGRTAAQVERAIRHVIDAAWRDGDMEQQQSIFGDTIDAKRGRPTCGEMIAQLADILRWEG